MLFLKLLLQLKIYQNHTKFQPDAAAGSAVSKITINQAGYYKIELTAMMTLNRFEHRIEVFKKSSGGTCDLNSVILGVYASDNEVMKLL